MHLLDHSQQQGIECIKKSQAILKCLWISTLAFGFRWAQETKPRFVTLNTFFSSTAGQGVENTK